jgi:hypothetical protein
MTGCGRSRGRRAEGEATGVLRTKFVLLFILFSGRDNHVNFSVRLYMWLRESILSFSLLNTK